MPKRAVDWEQLEGRVFQTTTGAHFTVVKVTAKNLLVRPEGGRRNYDLSIHDELERGIEAYAAGHFFPSPSELLGIGVRAVRTSFVWGVLHQLLILDELPPKRCHSFYSTHPHRGECMAIITSDYRMGI